MSIPSDDCCCAMMHTHSTRRCDCDNDFDCPDVLVLRGGDVFALPIRDGGNSFVSINYCPWCGARVPKIIVDDFFFFGATSGLPPEPFEEAFYLQIQDYEKHKVVYAVKAIKNEFNISNTEAFHWVRDSVKPFTIPLGPFPQSEAEQMKHRLCQNGLTVALVSVPGGEKV